MKHLVRLACTLVLVSACGTGSLDKPGNQTGATVDAGSDPGSPDADPGTIDDGRVKNGLSALYKFDEGSGSIIADSSGVTPPVNIAIPDPAAAVWLPGGGINLVQPTTLQAGQPPLKIYTACVASNEITVEAWVKPASLDQTSNVITYSIDGNNRNFSLAQTTTQVEARLRTTNTNNNGSPALLSAENLLTGLTVQHVVYTRDAAQAAIYIDGVKGATLQIGGNTGNWDDTYLLALGNEIGGGAPWLGEIHLAAVYCRRLSSAEVQQNYAAGY